MALADLNRSNDTPIATLLLSDIVPKNWHRFPAPVGSLVDANPNDSKPSYGSMADWAGGLVGDDVGVATATVALARSGGGANEPDYTPRNQQQRASLMVPPGSLAVDVARPRGAIGAKQPYPVAGDAPLAAPVITTLAPATAVAGAPSISVIITGTGYTQWSTVRSGGVPIPVKYLSPTQLQIIQNALYSVPGTVQVIVTDHNVDSAPSNFVFT